MKRFFKNDGSIPRWIGGAASTLGIVLMAFGIYRNELEVLFTKAVNICLECVGIG